MLIHFINYKFLTPIIINIHRFEAPIDTAQQLASSHLEWGATHDAWIFSIIDATQVIAFNLIFFKGEY